MIYTNEYLDSIGVNTPELRQLFIQNLIKEYGGNCCFCDCGHYISFTFDFDSYRPPSDIVNYGFIRKQPKKRRHKTKKRKKKGR